MMHSNNYQFCHASVCDSDNTYVDKSYMFVCRYTLGKLYYDLGSNQESGIQYL